MLNFSKSVCHASFSCSNFFQCNLKQNQRKSKTEMTKDGKKTCWYQISSYEHKEIEKKKNS